MVEVSRPTVTSVGGGAYRVEVTVANTGYLPTSLTDRGVVGNPGEDGLVSQQIVESPWVVLDLEGGDVQEGEARVRIPHLRGTNPFLEALDASSRTVSWTVRPTGEATRLRVTVMSTKGGTTQTDWVPVP